MAASAYHVISMEIEILLWQSSGILIFLCKYYIVVTDTLVGSLDVLVLLLPVILSELHEKTRRNDWVTEKSTLSNLREGYRFCDYTLPFLCLFVAFFLYSLPLPKWHTCAMATTHIYCYGWYPAWWYQTVKNMKIYNLILYAFFISNAFFNSLLKLPSFFTNWASKVA